MKAKTRRVWPGTKGRNLSFSLTMELVDLSWVCFPDCSLVVLSWTRLPTTHNMEASKLTCLVSQSRKFQVCFTLSRRQELTAFGEDYQMTSRACIQLAPWKRHNPRGSAQSRRIPDWLMEEQLWLLASSPHPSIDCKHLFPKRQSLAGLHRPRKRGKASLFPDGLG
jgi:hypothetical protein